jgi:hypothetical protein
MPAADQAAGVHGRQELGAGHVHAFQPAISAGGGLIGIQHPGRVQQLADALHERLQAVGKSGST